jgi:hypothetical protein
MEKDGPRRLILEAGHYCTKHGALGSNLFTFQEEFLCLAPINLRKAVRSAATIEEAVVR